MEKTRKGNWTKAIFFILGAIVTVLITKFFDRIIPDNPQIVKEVTDTITIVHKYADEKDEIEPNVINEKIDLNIKKRTIDYKQSNDFEDITIPKYNLKVDFNKPISVTNKKWKGYTYGDISAYAIVGCPDPTSPILTFTLAMLNKETLKDIAFFRCIITRLENNSRYWVNESYYEVKSADNVIGIVNNLGKGEYSIDFGFMLKEELTKEYPTFFRKNCTIVKK